MKNRDEIDRLRYILNKTDNLPDELHQTLCARVSATLALFDVDVKLFLLQTLDLTKHTKEEFRSTVSCVSGTKGKDGIRRFLLKDNCGFEPQVNRPEVEDVAPLMAMCQCRTGETVHLSNLKKLREMGYVQKQDIKDNGLLGRALKIHPIYHNAWDEGGDHRDVDENSNDKCYFTPNEDIFHYLLEWDPDALRGGECTLLQEVIKYHTKKVHIDFTSQDDQCYNYPISMMRLLLKAGLLYHPFEVGLLLKYSPDDYNYNEQASMEDYEEEDDDDDSEKNGYRTISSPFAMTCSGKRTFGPTKQSGWSVIEECLEEVDNRKILRINPETSIYPFMLAAADKSCGNLDLLYYLLKKDPSVLCITTSSIEEDCTTTSDEFILGGAEPIGDSWPEEVESKKRKRIIPISI